MAKPNRVDRTAFCHCADSRFEGFGKLEARSCQSRRAARRDRRPLLLLYFSGTRRLARGARPDVFLWRRRSGHGISRWLRPQLDGAAWPKSDEQILIRQGVEARRPSEIFVRATREDEKVTNVRVGGYAVEVLRGTVSLEN